MSNFGEFYLYTLSADVGSRCFGSPLPQDATAGNGLPTEALAGEFLKGKEHATVENFKQNPVFLAFLHRTIAKHIQDCPGFKVSAAKKQNGHIIVGDMRSFHLEGEPPNEDAIGVVEIQNGEAVKFHGIAEYKVFSEQGFMRIDPWLHHKLMDELRIQVEKTKIE